MAPELKPGAGQPDQVEDGETLLRSVFASLQHTRIGGKLQLAYNTFDDHDQEVSVDRAKLLARIEDAKRQPNAGVASITAKQVRERPPLDVRPDPLAENRAHALIYPRGATLSRQQFKKLCIALARVCNVHIEPTGRDYSAQPVAE